jgi:general nucleoside transport system ATP-binding protein
MTFLELHRLRKAYPGVLANDDISLQVEAGEIHGLVGENGAGKSTLMKLLYGMEQPDAGEIRLNGKRVSIANPQDAIRLGIGMVHQHFQLVPSLTVAENIALGAEPRYGPFLNRSRLRRQVQALSEQFGLQVDPNALVSDLPVGLQQRVEILKMLYRNARLLILDEPSAVLTPQEVESLFGVLRRLVAGGCTAIFITHKLYEIMALCTRATVLRRGRVVGTVQTADTTPAEIARLMVGHEVEAPVVTEAPTDGGRRPRLEVRNLQIISGSRRATQIDLTVFGGEILGVAGVEGNGQQELVEALIGVADGVSGEVLLDGESITRVPTRTRRERGLALIPEDRQTEGLSKAMAIWENLSAGDYYRQAQGVGVLPLGRMRATAADLLSRFDIRAADERVGVGTLSGGNAQKVVIARELMRDPAVLVAVQPTRGLDIGAAGFVHEQLLRLRGAGVGVLLISADLDELLALSDRIAVLFNGRMVAQFPRAAATREQIGLAMAGKTMSENIL